MTVVRRTRTTFDFYAMNETLLRTAFADLAVGGRVNLERSLRASGRMDGHIVQGHVDGVGVVTRILPEGGSVRVWIRAPRALRRYIAEKGSIAVDGVSLTVAGLEGTEFAIALIPHTLAITTLGLLRKGSRVNLEIDVLARYLERLLRERPGRAGASGRGGRAA
jgi:riboflavin synthase